MNDLKIFENEQFGEIRVVERDGEPWFVAADVCKVFGDTNRNRTMNELCDDEKGYTQMTTPGGTQNIAIVSESGLYSMLLSMQPTKAKARGKSDAYIAERREKLNQFRRWVTHDVLPSIRKHGGYLTPEMTEQVLSDPDTIIRLATELKESRAEKARLEAENSRLTVTNQMLYIENSTWDERAIINALVPCIAARSGWSIPNTWSEMYRFAKKKFHFDLKRRQQNYYSNGGQYKKHIIDFASDEEITKLTMLCATSAYELAINLEEVLNKVNANHVRDLIEEHRGEATT